MGGFKTKKPSVGGGCNAYFLRSTQLKALVQEDKTRQLYYILHDTLITDLAPQVAKANQGRPGTIKINEIC